MMPSFPRRVSLRSARALFDWWSERQPGASLDGVRDAVVARLAIDRELYSEVFEPSLSWDENGAHFRRFSYAFPGWQRDRSSIERALADFVAPFGDAASAACENVIAAARHAAVAQPLLGFADDGAAGTRMKLYLQFVDGASIATCGIVRALTSADVQPDHLDGSLHMIGLDFGDAGLRGAKLYVVPDAPIDVRASLGRSLDHALVVLRIADPTTDVRTAPREIDFGLTENGITEAALKASPLASSYADAMRAFDGIAARFRVGIRRVSFADPSTNESKLTLYYALLDEDGA